MADLSTLDVTQPPDTQAVAQGAQRIRETRVATVTSFGIEHALTGEHTLPIGAVGTRPAAGHSGRLFIDSVDNILQYDNGSSWTSLTAATTGMFETTNAGPVTLANGSFTQILGLPFHTSVTGTFACVAHFSVTYGASTLGVQWQINGGGSVSSGVRTLTGLTSGVGAILTTLDILSGVPIDNHLHSISIQGEGVGGTHTVTNIVLYLIPFNQLF